MNEAKKWPGAVRAAVLVWAALGAWTLVGYGCKALASGAPAELVEVNREVNRQITYRAEADPTRDVVQFGPKFGDCEDYAVTKRLRLIVRGWPKRDLAVRRVVVARTGECHAVLVATDPTGTRWMLDNRTAWVETVEQSGGRYDWRGC